MSFLLPILLFLGTLRTTYIWSLFCWLIEFFVLFWLTLLLPVSSRTHSETNLDCILEFTSTFCIAQLFVALLRMPLLEKLWQTFQIERRYCVSHFTVDSNINSVFDFGSVCKLYEFSEFGIFYHTIIPPPLELRTLCGVTNHSAILERLSRSSGFQNHKSNRDLSANKTDAQFCWFEFWCAHSNLLPRFPSDSSR